MSKHRAHRDSSSESAFEPDSEDPQVHRDHREHGGAGARPDDDELARRTERERVDAGLDDYDPDDVPPATDAPPEFDVTATPEYQEAAAEVRREESEGELYTSTDKHPDPPTHYDRS
jgi:hypothetical protein